jgi:glycosyltransferase involved in cell wall biosynthesis
MTRTVYNILYTTSFSTMAGGGQWSLYYLIKHLDKDRFHPVVLCPDKGELAEKMKAAGAEVIILKTGRIRSLNVFTITKLISIIKNRNIALIHTDSTTETFYAGIAAKMVQVPLVWHIRARDGEWLLDRILSAFSAKLILVADALRTRFERIDKRKAPTIYNGIDLEEFDASSSIRSVREEFGIDRETILLACIGRIEEKKGQEYLVSAMQHAANAKLLLAGSEDVAYLKRIKALCNELGISDRVIFAGQRSDIPALLRSCDILVVPTLTEAFSRVILEAMAAAKPVIATDAGGNPEAVIDAETGLLVRTQDTAALAEKISNLINNKEKRLLMGVAGRRRVEEKFDVRNIVRQIEEEYRELLGCTGPS